MDKLCAIMTSLIKANCSEFTLIFNQFQKLRLMQNRKLDIKICFQYRKNALNPPYIRNTFDSLLKYDVIGLFCLSCLTETLLRICCVQCTCVNLHESRAMHCCKTLFYVLLAIFSLTCVTGLNRCSCSRL